MAITKLVDWDDFLNERMRREDEAVARKFAYWTSLGRGHLRGDICGYKSDQSDY